MNPILNNRVVVKKLYLIQTRDMYRPVYNRTYDLNATIGTVDKFKNIVHSTPGFSGNTELTPSLVANNIPEVIRLQNLPTGEAYIPNGWSTGRYRFIMEVESSMNNNILVSYIQGFTEHNDMVSLSGYVDENSIFYINSITNVVKSFDLVNGTYTVIPRNTFNVISDVINGNRYQELEQTHLPKLVRPKEIMENMLTMGMYDHHSGRVINTTGTVGRMGYLSKKQNNDPIKYFTTTINGYIDGKNMSTGTTDSTDVLRNASASGTIAESDLMAQPLMMELHRVTGEVSPTSFTLNALCNIDPNVVNIINVMTKPELDLNQANLSIINTNDTADTLQPIAENMKAVMINNTINSIMMDNLIFRLGLSCTNKTGEYLVAVTDVSSIIEGIDYNFYCNKIIAATKNILLPMISDSGQTVFEVLLHSDILGDTNIQLSLNNGTYYNYRFPTFSDSLYTPVVTTDTIRSSLLDSFGSFMDATNI